MAALDIPAQIQSLDLSREDEIPALDWLTESHETPEAFWKALFEHANLLGPPLRSRPGKTQDLYYDAVLRHLPSDEPAFVWYEHGKARSLSFTALDARASACAAAWAKRGAKAGAPIAILLPLRPGFVIALAAALRLGLCICILDPATGPRALEPRLKALAPAHLVFDPNNPPAVGAFAELALPLVYDGPPARVPPHAYAPKEPCARLFSPLRAPLLVPLDLPAERALEHALRDAFFAHRLFPGTGLAAPAFSLQQHFPALLLSTLVAGACFVHLDLADIEAKPSLLTEAPVSALGVSPDLAAFLCKNPLRLSRLRHLFRSVDEPLDWSAYTDFVHKNDLKRVPFANVLIDAAWGGCLLFSTRRPGSVSARTLPAPGRSYLLLDPASGKPALGGAGVFVPMPAKDPKSEGFFLIASQGAEFLYGSTLHPRRAARVFPADEVIACVSALPGVTGACVVPVPTGDPGGRWAFCLLVFTGANSIEKSAFSARISRVLRDELGQDFLPEASELYPLHPHRLGQEVDFDWCHRQYSSGTLAWKAEHPVFRDLTALRARLFEP